VKPPLIEMATKMEERKNSNGALTSWALSNNPAHRRKDSKMQ